MKENPCIQEADKKWLVLAAINKPYLSLVPFHSFSICIFQQVFSKLRNLCLVSQLGMFSTHVVIELSFYIWAPNYVHVPLFNRRLLLFHDKVGRRQILPIPNHIWFDFSMIISNLTILVFCRVITFGHDWRRWVGKFPYQESWPLTGCPVLTCRLKWSTYILIIT